MQRQEEDAAAAPAQVLGKLRLLLERELAATQTFLAGEEHLAQPGQALLRYVPAGLRVVAIGPVVVAWGVDERMARGVELLPAALEHLVVARHAGARLEVAKMHHEVDLRLVDRSHQARKLRV